EPVPGVEKDVADDSAGHSSPGGKEIESFVAVAREAAQVEPDPGIAGAVPGEGRGRVPGEDGRIDVQALRRAFPPHQPFRSGSRLDCRGPDVAPGILKDSEKRVRREPVPVRIDPSGRNSREVLEPRDGGIAQQPLIGAIPPLAAMVLERDLVPSPAPLRQMRWKARHDADEPLTLEPVYGAVGRRDVELPVGALENR